MVIKLKKTQVAIPEYDVAIFKSGALYYAVSSTGVVISSNVAASPVITAAIAAIPTAGTGANSIRGTLFLATATYNITSTIPVPAYATLRLARGAKINVIADIDAIYLYEGASLEGEGIIDVSDAVEEAPGYSKTAVTVIGNTPLWRRSGGHITGVEIRNWSGSYSNAGTAIKLSSTNTSATTGYIWNFTVSNVKITSFNRAIHIYKTGETYSGQNWINGCRFLNLKIENPVQAIWIESGATNPDTNAFVANIFDNIDIQTGELQTATSGPIVHITGEDNRFVNFTIWDWNTGEWGHAVEFTAYAFNNLFECFIGGQTPSAFYKNLGTGNIITSHLRVAI